MNLGGENQVATTQTQLIVFFHPLKSPRHPKATAVGLTYVLEYVRQYGLRNTLMPRRIIRRLELEDAHHTRTIIGWALGYLEKRGFLIRWSRHRPARYVPTEQFYAWLRAHPCLEDCTTDGGTCGLYATLQCPFLRGLERGAEP